MSEAHLSFASHPVLGPTRPHDVDHYVSQRIRQRRIVLGLTQQQMADLIGVTYQQAHKYETGVNRISAGKLDQIAKALRVDVGYFFQGLDADDELAVEHVGVVPQKRLLLELSRNFANIRRRKHRDAVCQLARALAEGMVEDDTEAA